MARFLHMYVENNIVSSTTHVQGGPPNGALFQQALGMEGCAALWPYPLKRFRLFLLILVGFHHTGMVSILPPFQMTSFWSAS